MYSTNSKKRKFDSINTGDIPSVVTSTLLTTDYLRLIFKNLSRAELKKIAPVCKKWNTVKESELAIKQLSELFNLSENIIKSLKSPTLVNQRLENIYKEKKSILYTTYCASGIDENFAHLLDDNICWFENYFKNADPYFCAYHLNHACEIGNFELAQYLIEIKKCGIYFDDIECAAKSGSTLLLKYLLEKKPEDIYVDLENLMRWTILSGNITAIKVMADHLKSIKHPPVEIVPYTILNGGCIKTIEALYKTPTEYHINIKNDLDIIFSKYFLTRLNLAIFKFAVETLEWQPHSQPDFIHSLYRFAQSDLLKYAEEKYPDIIQNQTLSEEMIASVISSGNLKFIQDFMKKNDITSIKPKALYTQEILFSIKPKALYTQERLLFSVIRTGNLDLVKFLIEEQKFKSDSSYNLLKNAIESENISVVHYLISKGHQITDELCQEILTKTHPTNLRILSFVYHAYQDKQKLEKSLLNDRKILYYLMKQEKFMPQEEIKEMLLCSVYHSDVIYLQDNSKQLNQLHILFLQYLMNYQSIKPDSGFFAQLAYNKTEFILKNTAYAIPDDHNNNSMLRM